jgi:hypothetical protein
MIGGGEEKIVHYEHRAAHKGVDWQCLAMRLHVQFVLEKSNETTKRAEQ